MGTLKIAVLILLGVLLSCSTNEEVKTSEWDNTVTVNRVIEIHGRSLTHRAYSYDVEFTIENLSGSSIFINLNDLFCWKGKKLGNIINMEFPEKSERLIMLEISEKKNFKFECDVKVAYPGPFKILVRNVFGYKEGRKNSSIGTLLASDIVWSHKDIFNVEEEI